MTLVSLEAVFDRRCLEETRPAVKDRLLTEHKGGR